MSPNFSLTGELKASDGEPAGINPADTPDHKAATLAAIGELGQSSPPAVPASATPSAAGPYAAALITIQQSHGQFMPPAEHPEVIAYRQKWSR